MARRTEPSARVGPSEEESRKPLAVLLKSEPGATSGNESEPKSTRTVTRKRARKECQNLGQQLEPSVKRMRSKKGKLSGLMNVPIEVFTEISKYLYPLDLVLLARSNKFFRSMLMSRSAIQTWRHALNNVPQLPPCPKELCEPQYAAMLFSKHCSFCGKQAPRSMDAFLQVRLCASCRDSELCVPEFDEWLLVPTSHAIVPGNNYGQGRCLSRNLAMVRAKFHEFDDAGDRVGLLRWKEERRSEVARRDRDARSLSLFIREMENEQKDDIATRKGSREEEIKTRLLKLGWIEGDFKMREKRDIKKWNTLVCVAKPLTERTWESALPQLTAVLETNRELRLAEEARERRCQRFTRICEWISSYLRKLPAYAELADCSPLNAKGASDSTTTKFGSVLRKESLANDLTIHEPNQKCRTLRWPTPSISKIMSWSPFLPLLEEDKPHEQFEADMEELRPTLMPLLVEWSTKVERAIASRLPPESILQNDPTDGLRESSANPVPEFSVLVDSRPIHSLPSDVQRLFGADVVFTHSSSINFYPDDVQDSHSDDAASWYYDQETSTTAAALLVALGRSGATYLEMKAAGSFFACGRCCARNCVTWKQLVEHFYRENCKSRKIQKCSSVLDGTATYIVTHDTQSAQDGQPLAKVADDEDRKSPYTPDLRLVPWSGSGGSSTQSPPRSGPGGGHALSGS